jgi:predicted enzyme involved in methoxymalonyl-ACP biosynthesis
LEEMGVIAVILARPTDAGEMYIDTWLMSCRVLGRQAEIASLQALIEWTRVAGATALVGEYIPTARNDIVADHYNGLGFSPIGSSGELTIGATYWRLPIDRPVGSHHIVLETGCAADRPPEQRELMRRSA